MLSKECHKFYADLVSDVFVENMGWLPIPKLIDESTPFGKELGSFYAEELQWSMSEKLAHSIMVSLATNKVRYFLCTTYVALKIFNEDPNRIEKRQYEKSDVAGQTPSLLVKKLLKYGVTIKIDGGKDQYAVFELTPEHKLSSYDKSKDFGPELERITKIAQSKGKYRKPKKNKHQKNVATDTSMMSEEDMQKLVEYELRDLEI